MKKFLIDIGSDQEHEDLVAEVYYDDEFVCMLTQEAGFDLMDVAIYPREDGKPWTFKYEDFIKILKEARQRLWDLRKVTN